MFGDCPSPALAMYGLQREAKEGEKDFNSDVHHFIETEFYVDDALRSFPTETEAVDVQKRAKSLLACYNIKLHKIVSNKADVMNAFPTEDQVKNIKQLDLDPVADSLPFQRSLGVTWNMTTNAFTFNIHSKRGTLHH